MGAMENASKNCGDMINKLTLQMNKARQAVITGTLTLLSLLSLSLSLSLSHSLSLSLSLVD
jgi:hypothetical protein